MTKEGFSPEYTRFRLLDALYAGLLTCVVSSIQFIPITKNHFQAQLLALATVWAAIASTLDYHKAITDSWKIYLGSLMGGTVAVIGAAVVVACNGGKYNPLWGSLFALPFCFLGSCMYVGKMSEALSWVSFVVRLYSVATFAGEALPFKKMVFTVIMGFIADIIPVLVTGALHALGLLPRKGPPPFDAFEVAIRDFVEASVIFGMEVGEHKKDLTRRQRAMHGAMSAALPTASRSLQLIMFRMTAALDGFITTCTVGRIDSTISQELWQPLQVDLRLLCSRACCVLDGSPKGLEEAGKLRVESTAVKRRIKQMLISYTKGLVKHEGWQWLVTGRELSRVEAALVAIPHFAEAVANYCEEKPGGIRRIRRRDYVPLPPFLMDFGTWWKKPLLPQMPVWRFLAFPLRFVLAVQLLLWPVLGLSQKYPSLAVHGWWVVLVAVICSFPEVGPTISKALRRLAGVVVGGILAVLAIEANPGNVVALMLELFIVTCAARFYTGSAKLGYAGLQMGVTFAIMGFADSIAVSLTQTRREIFAAERFLFTLTGLIGSAVIQVVAWPSFSSRSLARATAAELKEVSTVVSTGILELLLRQPDDRVSAGGENGSDAELKLLSLDEERRGKVSSVREEVAFFRVLRIETCSGSVSGRKLLAGQEAIGQARTSAITAYEGLKACGVHMSNFAASVLLLPVRSRLSELAEACEVSGQRLSRVVVEASSIDEARRACQEIVDATMALIATFEGIRMELLSQQMWSSRAEDEDISSTAMVEALAYGGGLGLHIVIHVLEAFVRDWADVARILLDCDIGLPQNYLSRSGRPEGIHDMKLVIGRRTLSAV